MDNLMRDVLRCLWWPGEDTKDFKSRPTYWNISKRLGVSPKAVKSRLDSLKKRGILKEIAVRPDVSLFGFRKSGLLVSFDNRVRLALEGKTRLLDFVECVHIARIYLMQDGKIKVPSPTSSVRCRDRHHSSSGART